MTLPNLLYGLLTVLAVLCILWMFGVRFGIR
jgi:hypothetical protein